MTSAPNLKLKPKRGGLQMKVFRLSNGTAIPAVVESRTEAVGFYKKLGFVITDEIILHGDTFDCIRMEKNIT